MLRPQYTYSPQVQYSFTTTLNKGKTATVQRNAEGDNITFLKDLFRDGLIIENSTGKQMDVCSTILGMVNGNPDIRATIDPKVTIPLDRAILDTTDLTSLKQVISPENQEQPNRPLLALIVNTIAEFLQIDSSRISDLEKMLSGLHQNGFGGHALSTYNSNSEIIFLQKGSIKPMLHIATDGSLVFEIRHEVTDFNCMTDKLANTITATKADIPFGTIGTQVTLAPHQEKAVIAPCLLLLNPKYLTTCPISSETPELKAYLKQYERCTKFYIFLPLLLAIFQGNPAALIELEKQGFFQEKLGRNEQQHLLSICLEKLDKQDEFAIESYLKSLNRIANKTALTQAILEQCYYCKRKNDAIINIVQTMGDIDQLDPGNTINSSLFKILSDIIEQSKTIVSNSEIKVTILETIAKILTNIKDGIPSDQNQIALNTAKRQLESLAKRDTATKQFIKNIELVICNAEKYNPIPKIMARLQTGYSELENKYGQVGIALACAAKNLIAQCNAIHLDSTSVYIILQSIEQVLLTTQEQKPIIEKIQIVSQEITKHLCPEHPNKQLLDVLENFRKVAQNNAPIIMILQKLESFCQASAYPANGPCMPQQSCSSISTLARQIIQAIRDNKTSDYEQLIKSKLQKIPFFHKNHPFAKIISAAAEIQGLNPADFMPSIETQPIAIPRVSPTVRKHY